jgi:NADH:ubiquinone oxidoreductase subunit 4 (subunit M)
MMSFPILSLVTFLPLAGAVLFIFLPKEKQASLRWLRSWRHLDRLRRLLLLYFRSTALRLRPSSSSGRRGSATASPITWDR